MDIEDKDAEAIVKILKPLDLIVWKGHVVCVLDGKTTIESWAGYGVVRFNSLNRLSYIMERRVPANASDPKAKPHFVIRRWHPDKK